MSEVHAADEDLQQAETSCPEEPVSVRACSAVRSPVSKGRLLVRGGATKAGSCWWTDVLLFLEVMLPSSRASGR